MRLMADLSKYIPFAARRAAKSSCETTGEARYRASRMREPMMFRCPCLCGIRAVVCGKCTLAFCRAVLTSLCNYRTNAHERVLGLDSTLCHKSDSKSVACGGVHYKHMALTNCPDCYNKVSSEAEACPHCGRPNKKRVSFGIQCPNCKSDLHVRRMDAGERGVAFARGSLIGAFSKTYRCGSCDYIW